MLDGLKAPDVIIGATTIMESPIVMPDSIRQAWDWGAKRIWVHTCTLDHKDALSNYLARGMKIYKMVTIEDEYESES